MADFFQDLDKDKSGTEKNKPFFAVNHDNDQELLDWFNQQIAFLKEENQERLEKVKNNYLRYKGIQYLDQVYQPRDVPEKRIRYMPQVVVPLIADVVDEKVSRLLEYKPAVQCIPQSDESQDKIDAKIAKRFLKHVDQVESLDSKFRKAVKSAKIAGESFLFVLWSKDKGSTIVKAGETVQLKDGRIIKGPIKEGDVETKNATALEVLYEQARSWDDVEYLFYFDNPYTEKLKREYPEVQDKIHATTAESFFDYETLKRKSLEGRSLKISFWHKKTKFLPGGFESFFTPDVILKKGGLPYEDGELPTVRYIDNENEQELSGESFIDKVKGMASQYNNVTNMIIKQENMMSHPKWFVDANSVDDQALGNDMTIVKVKAGSRNPVLAQANPVSPQLFEFRKELKQEFYEQSKSNSVVRGEPPPGVTAFVALQYVSESENRRISSDVAITNECIRKTYELILKRAGQFYKKTDKRTMLIMGKDNRWTLQSFDPETLAKPYSILLQNSSALPESKALRTQFIMDMGQRFPNMFPESQLAEMLDLGQSEKMLDLAGLAARAAEDENELILDGKMVPDPKIHEDLITHWKVHVSGMQDIGFKTKSSNEIQKAMEDHIKAHEMLMFDMIEKSQSFAQLVNMQCPQFPLYFEIPMPAMAPPMPGAPGPQAPGMPPQAAPQVPEIQPLPGDPAFGSETPEETGVMGVEVEPTAV